MPLTAMADQPNALQALKRENVLSDEHVLAPNVWTGGGDAMMGLGADVWQPPASAQSGIPLASGMTLQTPNFSDPAFQNPASFLNYGAYVATTLAQNKALKKQKQQSRGAPAGGGAPAGAGGQSFMAEFSPYFPWLIGGGALFAILMYARKGNS